MAQTVSASIDTPSRGELRYVTHNGLANAATAWVGGAYGVSGTVAANTAYVALVTGSSPTYTVVGVMQSVAPSIEGTAATANGDYAGLFRIASGEFAFKNGNPATAGYELSSADIGKVCYMHDGQHVSKSGSLLGTQLEAPIAGIVTEVESVSSDGRVWVKINPWDRT